MARRGEVPFVAVPVGYAHDKEILGLAADLKIPRALALGYFVLLHDLVLRRGEARTGVLRDYKAHELAAQLDFRSNPRRLVEALKRAALLGTHRQTFKIPNWLDTITGEYAAKKAADREDQARWKREQRERERLLRLAEGGVANDPNNGRSVADALAELGVRVDPVTGRPVDVQWTRGGRPPAVHMDGGQKERKESTGQPPQPPGSAGGSLGASRWEWVREHSDRATNPEGCTPILARIPDDEWPLCQWVLTGAPGRVSRSSSRKTRVLGLDAYQILRNRHYLQFRKEWQEKLRADARPKNGHPVAAPVVVEDGALERAKREKAVAFMLEAMADETLPPAELEKHKRNFRRSWPDVPPPWETPPGGLPPPPTTH